MLFFTTTCHSPEGGAVIEDFVLHVQLELFGATMYWKMFLVSGFGIPSESFSSPPSNDGFSCSCTAAGDNEEGFLSEWTLVKKVDLKES